jgi:bacterioferritin-associated ferredoxin
MCVCAVCVCVCVREREIERTVVMPAAVMAELKNSVSLLSLKLAGRLVTCSLFAL